MCSRMMIRWFSVSTPFWNSVNKTDLAKLRKKTGYTFSNCKKALELNKDVDLAEKWLKEQAQALGWSKANKLQGRSTLQGLVGLAQKDDSAVFVEVNCETDFVARNKKFKSLVELAVESCFLQTSKLEINQSLNKVIIDGEELKAINSPHGKTLADHVALTIADLGENLNLRRAILIRSPSDLQLAIYTHPNPENHSKILTGKFGALLAYTSQSNDIETHHFARQLCQHVVGMNPTKVGIWGEDEPASSKDDESTMIHQEFLLDPDLSAGEFISNSGLSVVDFVRIECGEPLPEMFESPIKLEVAA